jgi:hypothetical protein
MKITRNKAVTLVTIILLLPILPSAFFTANAAQSGQGYQYNYIILNPDGLVGVGQIVYITCWTHRYVGQVGNPSSYFFHNWTVVVHRPDNKTEYVRGGGFHVPGEPEDTIWDSTATAFSSYTPTLNGTYIFEFYFPNQTVTSGSNAGYYWTNYNSTAKLVVQEEQIVYAMDSYPLPSEYWYRPIEAQNSWWAGFVGAVTSNWYNSVRDKNYNGNPNVRYQPDGIAPATAHIMWSAPIFDSPTTANLAASDYYTNPIFGTAIALRGQLFYPTTDGATWRQVDLRTGELINSTASVYDDISFGWNFDEQTENTHGVVQSGFLFTTNYARAMEATVLQIGHGWTWTMANVPTHGIEAIGSKGEHIIFSIANAGTTANPRWVVRDWNNSKVFVQSQTSFTVSSASSSTNSSDWQWNIVTRGTAPSKVVLAADSLEVGAYATNDPYYAKFDKAILLCRNGTMPSPGDRSSVTYFAIAAANQTIGKTNWQIGQLMWMKNIDAPSDGSSLVQGPSAEGVFTLVSPETGTWYGYDIMTGNLMWTTEPQTNYTPYGYTVGTNATGCTVSIGDHVVNATSLVPFPYTGKLITAGMGGVVFCYNLSNGAMLWHKEFPMSYSASVPNYPTNIGLLSDGKVYLGTFNPSADEPLLSGSMIRCLNTTDGSEIWSMPGFGSAGGYGVSDG